MRSAMSILLAPVLTHIFLPMSPMRTMELLFCYPLGMDGMDPRNEPTTHVLASQDAFHHPLGGSLDEFSGCKVLVQIGRAHV